jgi:eukaryotic-like serine/threonine-protein kinase
MTTRERAAGGRLLHGRYEIGGRIGHGGMGEVHVGLDRRLGRTVAVKILRADLATDDMFQARFRREAQSAAGLNHPSIVAVYDTGDEVLDGVAVPYIVMEYVEGRTLRDVLAEGRRILPERALEIAAGVCDALEYSHRSGIIHRDIKPANVMLTPDGDVKVMDFGIARALADTSATMTQTAAVIGTAQYLSPEQAMGKPVDARSDIYSTGCLLYELLAGRPPFVGDSPISVAYQHVQEPPHPPSRVDAELPPLADAITLTALRKNPAERYQSAGDMRSEIQRGLAGQHVAPAPVQQSEPATTGEATARVRPAEPDLSADEPSPTRPRTTGYALLGLAAVLLLAVSALVGLLVLDGNEPRSVLAPTLVGRTEAGAHAVLAGRNLQVGKVVRNPSDSVPRGRVVAQNPKPGESVDAGGTVAISVSAGRPLVFVPDVEGMQVAEAKAQLVAKGFEVRQKKDHASTDAKGTVTRSAPDSGRRAPAGSTVTLSYSAGLVAVPDVVGRDEDVAAAILEDAGFVARRVVRPTTDTVPGTVVAQNPTAEAMAERGSPVTIAVAAEPTPAPEPSPSPSPTDDGGGLLDIFS